jgi:hypothetical protein
MTHLNRFTSRKDNKGSVVRVQIFPLDLSVCVSQMCLRESHWLLGFCVCLFECVCLSFCLSALCVRVCVCACVRVCVCVCVCMSCLSCVVCRLSVCLAVVVLCVASLFQALWLAV